MIDDDGVKSIENLHRLKSEGIITDEEFEQSKQRILFGQGRGAAQVTAPRAPAAGLPGEDDHLAWVTLPLRRYADFDGRSTRREYWMFQLIPLTLFVFGVAIAGASVDQYGDMTGFGMMMIGLVMLGFIGLLVPLLAVQARRLHDQDRSGWLVLLNLIPYIGALAIFVIMLLPGTRGDNRFGPDPLAP